jgi:alcohol dehydrogenase class IV
MQVQLVHVGVQGIEEYIQAFRKLDGADKNLFLIAGKHSYEASGVAKALSGLLSDVSVIRFSGYSPNPKVDEVQKALAAFNKSGASRIVVAGGGSALDIGKLVNYFSSTKVDPAAYVHGERGKAKQFLPLLAIPTTAGSGSEATHFAVLYDGFNKLSIADSGLLPSHTWLNAAFTESLLPLQTACCGFDALAQAIESYWAVGSTSESQLDSAKAIRLCQEHLDAAVLRPTLQARAGMLKASHLAGRAINVSKTTAAHAMSYAMTGHYGLAHGYAVALLLPAVLEVNDAVTDSDVMDSRGAKYVQGTMRQLYGILGFSSAKQTADYLRDLRARIGLSMTWFRDQGVDPKNVRILIQQEVNQERLANNPRRFTPELVKQVVASIQ